MLEEVASYIWAHGNSLIKNLTPFQHDAEIRLFSVTTGSYFYQDEFTQNLFLLFKQL